jgi:phosphatidylglycerophosphatase C
MLVTPFALAYITSRRTTSLDFPLGHACRVPWTSSRARAILSGKVQRVQLETSHAVVGRISVARTARPGGVVAFDADGTLWSGDVGDDFFHGVLGEGRIEPDAIVAMQALAAAHHVMVPEGGPKLAAALYDAYREGHVPEASFCEMVAYLCSGWTHSEVEALAAKVIVRGRLPERMHAETAVVLEWLRRERVEAFVVSASPLAAVLAAVQTLGFDADHVLAVTPVEREGRFSTEVQRPIPYGSGKVTRLSQRIGARPLYAAFGDNVFDIPLLRSAEIPIAVRPKPRLIERAGEVPGLVEMR